MEATENDADSENIYMNEEDADKTSNQSGIYDSIYMNTTTESPGSAGACERKKVILSDMAAVALGILCVLLLAVIIVLCIKHNTELHQIQSHNENMTTERDGLQSRYNILNMEKDQLMNLNHNLTSERNQLQSSYDTLRSEREAMQKKLKETEFCPYGWIRFLSRCYLISTDKRTWEESRQACIRTGADLVIINSREEQQFVSEFHTNIWIGLTDRDWEGQWKWVDNTALLSGYWMNNEPNNGGHHLSNEDCVELVPVSIGVTSNWNDVKCSNVLYSLCERFGTAVNNR